MKLLLIMPRFFDYPELIKDELNGMGYEVDFFDDRPSTNVCVKAAIRINKKIIHGYINKYFNEVMETVKDKEYDVVLLISGQSLSFDKEMIKQIKECQPKARFLLYQWDSQINFPYIKQMQNFFDRCYSFDKRDVKDSPKLKFLPLFYGWTYEKIGLENNCNNKYDICFVGTAHPKKYKFISMMSRQLESRYPSQFIYFFFPSRMVYFYRKIINKEFREAHYREFHYVSLKGEEMADIYANSRCVLDSPQTGQSGLTIRVMEALGAKKKLITTNKDIQNYDFYRPENIYIYDGKIDYGNVFFNSDYVEIDRECYGKYSLRSWLAEILE